MGDLSGATREIMWNISPAWLMYALAGLSLAVFAYGLQQRVASWRRGKPDDERFSEWGRRLWLLLGELLFQRRVRQSVLPGLFHGLIFYSFLVLILTTAVVASDYDFGTHLFEGMLYVVLSIAAEAAGVLIVVGLAIAAFRRTVLRPQTLTRRTVDGWMLLLVGFIVVSGFLVEGARIAAAGDRWAGISPVGNGISFLLGGMSPETGRGLHAVLWWVHTGVALLWIATIPYTKYFHLIALPTNLFFRKLEPWGTLQRQDIQALLEDEDLDENDFNVGVEKTADLSWKRRLDLDACVECGRCEEVCPAYLAGHPFSPKQMIAECRDLLRRQKSGDGATIVGQAFDSDFLWFCRTCTACMEVCPACVEHVDALIDLRRNEVVMQGRLPADGARALRMLEKLGNPFGPQDERIDWIDDSGIRVVGPGESCDVIYWIGCCTTFDPTKQRIASDLCRLLKHCGIEFGVLGADERCCGDPARVMGDERLFQETAKRQVEAIRQRDFRVLLTSCPHCYNVLKNEYPQFGGDFNVVHHSEFLHEMVWSGQLQFGLGVPHRIVYHDPCYLGRYQKIFEAPREVLNALPGVEIVEMRNHHQQALCCGGGGGHFWMDLKGPKRINNMRVEQAREVGADTIVTGCAYCLQMLEDSVKLLDLDEEIRVIDLASLSLESLLQGGRSLRGRRSSAGAAGAQTTEVLGG